VCSSHAVRFSVFLGLLHEILDHWLHGLWVALNACASFPRLQEILSQFFLKDLLLNLSVDFPCKFRSFSSFDVEHVDLFLVSHGLSPKYYIVNLNKSLLSAQDIYRKP
jgi:hypothetical protein